MFHELPMASEPGARFHYNNAGYILLGLLVEKLSGLTFTDYVEQHIFAACQMEASGYFELDALPGNTAQGYIVKDDGTWTTNVYSIPVKGAPTAAHSQRLLICCCCGRDCFSTSCLARK